MSSETQVDEVVGMSAPSVLSAVEGKEVERHLPKSNRPIQYAPLLRTPFGLLK
jgi:hypothetical protein